jgi:hypothetical protein
MQNQSVKNRNKKLETAYAKTTNDCERLYRIATDWRATAIQKHEESKLFEGVAFIGFAFMSSVIIFFSILREVSK